jgi:hypothetical protein
MLSAELVGSGSLIQKQDQTGVLHTGKPSSDIAHGTRPVYRPQPSKYKEEPRCHPGDEENGCVDVQIFFYSMVGTVIGVNSKQQAVHSNGSEYTFRNIKTDDGSYQVDFTTSEKLQANFKFWSNHDTKEYMDMRLLIPKSTTPDNPFFITTLPTSATNFTCNQRTLSDIPVRNTKLSFHYYPS